MSAPRFTAAVSCAPRLAVFSRRACALFTLASAILAAVVLVAAPASAQTEGILHSFGKGVDGNTVYGSLISDASGNLYGTTFNGGTNAHGSGIYGAGIVFELSPQTSGKWVETVLYNFGGTNDGTGPTAGLAFDTKGNLFGTTQYGGGSTQCQGGCGIVFELKPPAVKGGAWTEAVLYRFEEQFRGRNPQAGVIFDSTGALYGTTAFGGADNFGTIYRLTPKKGEWTLNILYSFGTGSTTDGRYPGANLIQDASGNFYSTTPQGGANDAGTVFELSPLLSGAFKETILHDFDPSAGDGSDPTAPLVLSGGNLFGSTAQGGANNLGTVFELQPSGTQWNESVLYSFGVTSSDATVPGALAIDSAGDIFGFSVQGGTSRLGTAFELTSSNGTWTETILHDFGSTSDGRQPSAGPVLTSTGNIFGVCSKGGAYFSTKNNGGTVFEISLK